MSYRASYTALMVASQQKWSHGICAGGSARPVSTAVEVQGFRAVSRSAACTLVFPGRSSRSPFVPA